MRADRLRAALLVVMTMAAGACTDGSLANSRGTLAMEPALDFGSVILGHRPTLVLHLQNTSRATIRLGAIHFEEPGATAFSLPEPPPTVLMPGAKAAVVVGFVPLATGLRRSRLAIPNASSGAVGWTIDVSGEGVLGLVDVAPTELDFGDIGVGTRASRTITLTNKAATPAEVVVSAPNGDDAAFFDASLGGSLTVGPTSSVYVAVGFAPNRMGPFVAHLSIQPCPTCDPLTVPIRGNGVAATFVVDPPVLDFGHVALNATSARQVSVKNVGTRTAQLLSAQLGSSSSQAFAVAPMPANGRSLAPGESISLDVAYAPVSTTTNAGTIRIATDDVTSPMLVVALAGGGDGPALAVSPSSMVFATTGLGVSVQRTLSLRNVGTDPTGTHPLLVQSISVTHGVEFETTVRSATGLPLSIPPGQSSEVTVTYTPIVAGESHGTIEIKSNDPSDGTVEVALTGSAEQLGECTYAMVPAQLPFGVVAPGTESVLAFAIRNVGSNPCAIANVRLSAASDLAFSINSISSRIVAPGDQLVVPVTFAPDSEATFTGLVQFDASSRNAPMGRVMLSGSGARTCLTILPGAVDFGSVGLLCQHPMRTVIARNDCPVATDIRSAWIGTGTSEAFSLGAGEGGATTLLPGAQLVLSVTYAPGEARLDSAPLFIDSSETATPHTVSLIGLAQQTPTKTDTFVEGTTNKVDVLFVVDNSGSMSDKQQSLALNAANFINRALRQNADFHLGVTSTGLYSYDGGWGACTGGASGGEAGRLFPVDGSLPRIVTNNTPNAVAAFASNMQVGICHWWEEGLEATRLALSSPLVDSLDDPSTVMSNDGNGGFLRSDAKLYIFYVTDADDSDSTDVSSYVAMLKALKPGRPDMVSVSGVLGLSTCNHIESVGTRYMQLIGAMGGRVFDICADDWGSTLGQVADDAFTPSSVFPLSQAPDAASLTVSVDGVSVAAQSGTLQIWHYNPALGDHGAVVFETDQAPRAGARVDITYPVPCP